MTTPSFGPWVLLSPSGHALVAIVTGPVVTGGWGGPSSSPLLAGTHPSMTKGVGCQQTGRHPFQEAHS